jgi:hypothetical protein
LIVNLQALLSIAKSLEILSAYGEFFFQIHILSIADIKP